MATGKQPSLDVVIERLGQNTQLTKDIGKQVAEGFKTLNGRINANERRIDKLEWEQVNDHDNIEDAKKKGNISINSDVLNIVKWLILIIAGLIGVKLL